MDLWAFVNVDDPLVAWLAYRGEVFSPEDPRNPNALSMFAASRLSPTGGRTMLWPREAALEDRRANTFSGNTSRLRGFYGFDSEAAAGRAAAAWGLPSFTTTNLTRLRLSAESHWNRYDSEWITHDLAGASTDWFDRYLSGAPRGTDPLWEYVVEGSAAILNDSLRDRARRVALNEWPESDVFLELGRIAFLLGYPLGRISATIVPLSDGMQRVHHLLNMVDADNPAFLAAVSRARQNPAFPYKWADLTITDRDFDRTPDLSNRSYVL